MKYKTGYCFTAPELFPNLKNREIKVPKEYYRVKVRSCKFLYGQVLTYAFYLIIKDMIENNVTFLFPLFGNKEASLYIKSVDGEEFKYAYQRGCFAGIDWLQSNFTGYQIYMEWINGTYGNEKPIYISHNVKDIFYEKINSGKKYYATELVEIHKYWDAICERFPMLNLEQIKRIVVYGMQYFYTVTSYGGDVLLKSRYFTMYSGYFFSDELKFYEYWRKKTTTKLRIMYNRKKEYNGYYYFGLTDELYQKQKDKKVMHFDRLLVFKLEKECLLHTEFDYFFRFKREEGHFDEYLHDIDVEPEYIASKVNKKIVYENGDK